MSNPCSAFRGVKCDDCGDEIPEGDDVYFHEAQRLCKGCGEKQGIVCDCGAYKRPEYEQCYGCKFN